MAATSKAEAVEEFRFDDDGLAPNNPALPLVVYRAAIGTGAGAAAACEALFAGNGWVPAWRNGIFAHHHYHSTAHEALGIVSGSARVRLGGEGGRSVELRAGDVVVIPAGVAHKSERASPDLLVVGAYPRGQNPDMRTPAALRHAEAKAAIAAVPLPERDPVGGEAGPIRDRWGSAAKR
jgi:uncharacterized protein YjlB